MRIDQEHNENFSILKIMSETAKSILKITSPGYATINIDIIYESSVKNETKRITLEPDELEIGLLQDILEQFILEFKSENEVTYDNIE